MFDNTEYVGAVQYSLHVTRPVSTSAVSVSPWAPSQAGASPPFTNFKLLIFSTYRHWSQCAGSRGDGTLSSSCPRIFTLVEMMHVCWKPGRYTHWQPKSQGQTITPKLMDWETGDQMRFFYRTLQWGWGIIFLALIRVKCIFLWEIPFSKGCLYSKSTVL